MRRMLLCAAVLTTLVAATPAGASTLPTGFEERVLADGLTQPVAADWTPDGRMLVLEKPGRLKVVAPGTRAANLVLDFSADVNSVSDRGALGLAVDSQYATNNYV